MTFLAKRYMIVFLAAALVLTSISCMAVTRLIYDPTPTPISTPSPVHTRPAPAPSPEPTRTATPAPTADDCPNGDCITGCISHLKAIAQPGSAPSPGGLKSAHRDVSLQDGYVLVTYTVSADKILSPDYMIGVPANLRDYQLDTSSQKKIWDYFSAIIPPEQRSFLEQYDVFTDGRDNILASVSQSQTDMGRWVLTVDIVDAANPQDLTFTLVHEFGHLLTLNPSQVTPSELLFKNPDSLKIFRQEANACKTYFANEGCSHPDSYINKFFDRFWPEIYDEWLKIDALSDQNRFETALEKFYEKYKDQFVTDYAPTNPVEDIAETFTFFVIKPKPAGESIADQKVLFFYDFPELVQLRSQIAHRLCAQLNQK
jgi:hypothetical protein